MPSTPEDTTPDPMMKLEPGGVAPIISYNVPEPTTYSGRNFIDLQFPASYFVVGANPTALRTALARNLTGPDEEAPASLALPGSVEEAETELMSAQGKRLQVYRSMSGALATTWVEANVAPEPHTEPGARIAMLPVAN